MTLVEAALKVLEEESKPLHYTQLLHLMFQRGYAVPGERPPRDELLEGLVRESRREGTRLQPQGQGTYSLKEDAPS